MQELELALREAQEMLGVVVGNAPVILFATDAAGIVTVAEGRGRDSLRLAPDAGIGQSVFELFNDQPVVSANFRRALRGESFRDAVQIGGLAFETWYAPWRDPSGGVQGVIGVATEVTQQRRAEAALERSEARFAALLRSTPDVIAIVAVDGTLEYCSPAAVDVLGYEPHIGRGSTVLELVHPDDRDRVMDAARATTSGSATTVECRVRHADGSWRWLEVSTNDLRDDPEVGGLLIAARDVTLRKDTEEALRVEETRFGAMVEHLSDMIVLIDAGGSLLYASPSARRLAGTSTGPFFGHVDPDDLPHVYRMLADVLTHPGVAHELECRIRTPDGWRHIATTATNLLNDSAVQGIVCNCRDITDGKQAEEQLARQAYHDDLTGLPNRALFMDRLNVALARARRRQSNVAVLFLDLDRFKVINDSLGHEPGDRLLTAVARRLEGALRPEDTVARFGGDEFTVLCEDIRTDLEPVSIAERIGRALATPFVLDEREVFVTASIGIAVAPETAPKAESLLRDADAAMYRAKERGRARFEVFDEATRARAMERLETEHDLHRAIDREELCLLFQPIIDLTSGSVTGVEALLRWQHPTRGLIEPAGFIPLAEETGLIIPIGEWALVDACRQIAQWRRRGLLATSFSMSVNLSAGQLAQPRLRQALDDVLQDGAIDPSQVWLEITESALMEDADAAIATLRGFKDRGLCLSIDDFGTGYSSLSYLKRLPIDALKVDRSFVRGLVSDSEDHAIAEAVVALAHTLGLGAVAEGVETTDQLVELRSLGCDSAQGFLFSRPIGATELERLLLSQPRW